MIRTTSAAVLTAAALLWLRGTAPPAHANGPSLAQLVSAVCDMTAYAEGKRPKGSDPFPQSVFEAVCAARTTLDHLFLAGYAWGSGYDVWWHDLTHLSDFYRATGTSEKAIESLKGTYVAIAMNDGSTWSTFLFVDTDSESTAALAPLQTYIGLTVSPIPPQA
jgi:hypothetical protein